MARRSKRCSSPQAGFTAAELLAAVRQRQHAARIFEILSNGMLGWFTQAMGEAQYAISETETGRELADESVVIAIAGELQERAVRELRLLEQLLTTDVRELEASACALVTEEQSARHESGARPLTPPTDDEKTNGTAPKSNGIRAREDHR